MLDLHTVIGFVIARSGATWQSILRAFKKLKGMDCHVASLLAMTPTSYHSNEPSKITCPLGKITYLPSKITYRLGKTAYQLSNITHRLGKTTNRLGKTTHRLGKTAHQLSKISYLLYKSADQPFIRQASTILERYGG